MGKNNHQNSSECFLTQSEKVEKVLQLAARIAPTKCAVLIQGESGTGKELIAKHLHASSDRSTGPMVSLNCGALTRELLLSELFGHEAGAFTGATQSKQGLVELAHGGTLFLDEIGEMHPDAQSKLLRFLQEGEMYRVGGKEPISVDVRVISATNRDLEKEVEVGRFRQDLYFRINAVSLELPPLRERPEDVQLLLEHFLGDSYCGVERKLRCSPEAWAILRGHSWPGNVRELRNLVERFKILVDGDIVQKEDIPFWGKSSASASDDCAESDENSLLLNKIEQCHILKVLRLFDGNKTKAAQAMGITVKTLYNKLARYEAEKKSTENNEVLNGVPSVANRDVPNQAGEVRST